MPQYMLLIYEDPTSSPAPDSPQAQAEFGEYGAFTRGRSQEGPVRLRRAAADERHRDDRARQRQRRRRRPQRRPVRRDQGVARRLLPARLPRPRHGDRAGGRGSRRRRHGAIEVRPVDGDCPDDVQRGRGRARLPRGVRARPRHADPPPRRDFALAEDALQDAFARGAARRWPATGVPAQPRRVDHRDRAPPGDRPAAPRARARRPRPGPADRSWTSSTQAEPDPGHESAVRRRPAAPHLHVLPPGARARGAGRADAAHARRPDDARDRARVPRPRGDDGPAPRPRQAQDRAPRGIPYRVPPDDAAARAPRRRARRRLPRVQRGLRRARRRPRWSAPSCAPRRSASAACSRELMPDDAEAARPARAHAAARLAPRARASTPTARSSLLADQDRARWDAGRDRGGHGARSTARSALRPARALPAAGGDRRAPRDRRRPPTTPTGAQIAALYGRARRATRRSPVVAGQPGGRGRHGATARAPGLALLDALGRRPPPRRLPAVPRRPRRPAAPRGRRRRGRGRLRPARSRSARTPSSAPSSSAAAPRWPPR